MPTPTLRTRATLALLSAMIGALPSIAAAQLSTNGFFRVAEEERGSELRLDLTSSRDMSHDYSSTSFSLSPSELSGLTRAQLESGGTAPLHFTLTRDAGVLTFEGELRGGRGSGTY